jgi:hypothetical protein
VAEVNEEAEAKKYTHVQTRLSLVSLKAVPIPPPPSPLPDRTRIGDANLHVVNANAHPFCAARPGSLVPIDPHLTLGIFEPCVFNWAGLQQAPYRPGFPWGSGGVPVHVQCHVSIYHDVLLAPAHIAKLIIA